MNKEIGSEFWNTQDSNRIKSINNNLDKQYYLSGRTALDAIIKDAIKTYRIKTAYLPEYCCDSILKPFISNGIKLKFYKVNVKNGKLNFDYHHQHNCDVVFLMEFFGFNTNQTKIIAQNEDHAIVIQDLTHSLFQSKNIIDNAKYVFASPRKWTAIPAAAYATGIQSTLEELDLNNQYIELRKEAMVEKKKYMKMSNIYLKKSFLSKFSKAEEILNDNYQNYEADWESIQLCNNIDKINVKQKRRKNAIKLLNGLKDLHYISLFDEIGEDDCPLFVPILLDEDSRFRLCRYLIDNSIYCPIHWPVSQFHKSYILDECELYHQELSLICDQRYGEKEMNTILNVLNDFKQKESR